MIYTTYILYSKSLNRFYVGATSMAIIQRLKRHNSNHNGFTGKTNDWIVIYTLEFESLRKARSKENIIKGRGAARYIKDLNN